MIPILRQTAERRLALPRLDGGLNLKNGQSDVLDNQMTDCKNVWFADGVLKTRPALEEGGGVFPELTEGQTRTIRTGESTAVFNGVRYTLITETVSRDMLELPDQTVTVRFFPDTTGANVITAGTVTVTDEYAKNLISRSVLHEGNVYCYLRYDSKKEELDEDEEHLVLVDCKKYEVWKIERRENGTFAAPEAVEPYAPLVITNVWASVHKATKADMVARGATMIEGFNLLGNRYRIQGSTYDASESAEDAGTVVEGHTDKRYACYELLYSQKGLEGEVKLEYTDKNGKKIEHKVDVTVDYRYGDIMVDVFEDEPGEDGLYLHVGNDCVNLSTAPEYGCIAQFSKEDFIRNNMIITALCPNNEENQDKVFNMTKSVWFGGAARGIHGGSRLFLGGNTNEKEKALVLWSDLNNPLYFDENCYTYVGDKAQAVTAFGRQGSALVIFKERELFYTQYEQGASINADDVTEQNVVDVVTRSAYFPVTQISGSIGCDCPDTVQLCRNRLVWASSDKRVYELIAENQYTERAAVPVSDMIARALNSQSIENLKDAHAVDWRGHYLLFVQDHVYVMDYNSYGFSYAASYTKEESAEARIPWYIWELPFLPDGVFAAENLLYLFKTDRYTPGIYPHTWTCVNYLTGTSGQDAFTEVTWDEETHQTPSVEVITMPIETVIQTKFFDFGSPAILKRVKLVDVSLGENDGEPVRITFLSEVTHEDAGEVTLKTRGAEEGSAESFVNKQVRPYTFACARFGIRLEANGCMKLDKIMLTYSILGGARWR